VAARRRAPRRTIPRGRSIPSRRRWGTLHARSAVGQARIEAAAGPLRGTGDGADGSGAGSGGAGDLLSDSSGGPRPSPARHGPVPGRAPMPRFHPCSAHRVSNPHKSRAVRDRTRSISAESGHFSGRMGIFDVKSPLRGRIRPQFRGLGPARSSHCLETMRIATQDSARGWIRRRKQRRRRTRAKRRGFRRPCRRQTEPPPRAFSPASRSSEPVSLSRSVARGRRAGVYSASP